MDDDHAIVEDLRRRIAASPFHAGFGISVEHAAAGDVRLGWEARPDHRNLQGLVHGGILATLVDIAMGLAVRTVVGPTRRHVTIDLDVHYLRPARPGRLEAVGSVVRVGKQVGFAEGTVTDASGRLLVRASGTYSVTEDRTNAEDGTA
ncbi:MAG: PaaI family thioesterase [Actinomycetota bacterium]|nr:PaaI family thioesterase [Actinomycetota bacterium]